MSEAAKMGLFGSKEDDKDDKGKEESPERYVPYSVDSNAEAYDTEALSIMDINDIIGVQTEPVGDSTLEGEMAALSAMITDTKPDEAQDEPSGSSGGSSAKVDDKEAGKSVEGPINKSLQLIGEAYISEDSQEIDEEADGAAEPKVLFSCKPLVDKRSSREEDDVDLVDDRIEAVLSIDNSEKPIVISVEPSSKTLEPKEMPKAVGEDASRVQTMNSKPDPVEEAAEKPEPLKVMEVNSSGTNLVEVNNGQSTAESRAADEQNTEKELEHSEPNIEEPVESLPVDEVALSLPSPAVEAEESTVQPKSEVEETKQSADVSKDKEPEASTAATELDEPEETTDDQIAEEVCEVLEAMEDFLPDDNSEPEMPEIPKMPEISEPTTTEETEEPDDPPVERPFEKGPSEREEPMQVDEPVKGTRNDVSGNQAALVDDSMPVEEKSEKKTEESAGKNETTDTAPILEEPAVEDEPLPEPMEVSEPVPQRPASKEPEIEEKSAPEEKPTEPEPAKPEEKPAESNEIATPEVESPRPTVEASPVNTEAIADAPEPAAEPEQPQESVENHSKPTAGIAEVSKTHAEPDEEETNTAPSEFQPTAEDNNSQGTQEMMDSILDTVESVANLKEILDNPAVIPGISSVLTSPEIPLPPANIIEDLEKKLSESTEPAEILDKNLDDAIEGQNIDSLEGLLDLDLIPADDEPVLKEVEPIVEKVLNEPSEDTSSDTLEKSENVGLLMEFSEPENINEGEDLFTDAMEGFDEAQRNEENLEEVLNEVAKASEAKEAENAPSNRPMLHVERSFNLDQQEKMDIPDELLAGLPTDVEAAIDPLAANSEISELESAVKFLQESEEQEIESPLALSPKLVESVVENLAEPASFSSKGDICDEPVDLDAMISDPIAISEAEIISEAAKLESERKQKEEAKLQSSSAEEESKQPETVEAKVPAEEVNPAACAIPKPAVIPKISILEERLKEPPKIEIPLAEPRICDSVTTPKTSLLIQRDARVNYQKMMDSPKAREEVKPAEPPRKDHEKHEVENVGSPRIILKIAKSAIADCAEPRSPKSPKIRSAANSPNPEDSPGQKLGKIRMKLSRSGHPSIIPNESEEQRHPDSSALSPLGMKIKLSKSGDASIVQPEKFEEEKRLESPIGMKIKLSKSGDASIVQQETKDKHKVDLDSPKRTESPIGMKFKLSKSGDASIIQPEEEQKDQRARERTEVSPEASRRTDSPLGMKIKLSRSGDASIISAEHEDAPPEQKRTDSPMGMKMKISKKTGASLVESSSEPKDKLEVPDVPRRTESPLGMKIKLSKSGDASIIHSEVSEDIKHKPEVMQISPSIAEGTASPIGMKIKLSKSGDATIIHDDEPSERRTDSPIGMKIKLSKTGDASIVHSPAEEDKDYRPQKTPADPSVIESMKIKLSKTGHPTIIANEAELQKSKESIEAHYSSGQINRSEVTIEPIKKPVEDVSLKRKDISLSPGETKKTKLETKLSQILPEVTIQPLIKQPHDPLKSTISRQQMNVINQEISITQVRKAAETAESFNNLEKEASDDVQIIDPHPELIIVNENSSSSQDVMIIDEVPPIVHLPEVKVPKKRGRPRRIGVPPPEPHVPQDPLSLDEPMIIAEPKENERPKRTCSRQKSYAPPKRGRGRGRGKRKIDRADYVSAKKARLEQDLTMIENQTTALITLDDEAASDPSKTSELYKALRQPLKSARGSASQSVARLEGQIEALLDPRSKADSKSDEKEFGAPDRQNWLTPSSRKSQDIPAVQVIDEDTRMSAESFSRSQTPARSIPPHAGETINEESQGSVLSTATTESEKVKVKNRRMEINFDPDEGPFTVDKIAEYEWPVERKGETFMIQEQISQYLGVKSFKRKYPDLKRRMVDMEERNFLRENGLVSESMCDMGLTAVYSSEALDIMCSDFPDQYEEYRKHMRERQIKEHSKKQKELTAAANAEKNRIDLAEMAVQSALSWNVTFNKARRESRRCSLDLQTFTIHVPKKQQKVEDNSRVSHYPVALIPGQYTDYYREYTPAELRYYPLNTVLYGPMRPNERKFDSQSEGSQSDSDSDSSSDDSSCSSSEGTQDTEESQSTMDEVDIELSNQKTQSLKCKMCLKHLNKCSKAEVLIQCGTCSGYVHPSCIDLTLDMVPHIQAYAWQCTDCKTCAQCHDPADEDKMLFCDMCDRGYHIYCVGLRRVPQGRWHCQECAICGSCGSREAGGINADRNSVAQWQHEYKKGDKNTRVYVSTLCVPCSKLWRKGRYCPNCSRCHTVPRLDLEENLVHCSACDKYLHLDCVESKDLIDRRNYQCDYCAPNRQMGKTLVSKALRS